MLPTTPRRLTLPLALLLTILSCGEIEIPEKKPQEPTTENTSTPTGGDTGKTEDSKGEAGNGQGEAGNDAGENGNDKGETEGTTIGCACLTADGHLLIDGRIYVSLHQFFEVHSALSNLPAEALDYAASYTEGNLREWRIPTADEAQQLREALACESPYYGKETLPRLNQELEQRGYNGIYRERFLCEDATKTYDFSIYGTITKASKTQKYHLLLVHSR